MKKIKVLIIEDDNFMQLLYKKVFRSEYFDCTVANNGEAGLESYQKNPPDLVILDMLLPVLPGYLVLRRIRRNYNDTKTKIIVSTSLSGKSDIVACTKLGIQGYIVKPFDFMDVRKRVLALFSITESNLPRTIDRDEVTTHPKMRSSDIVKQIISNFVAGKSDKKQTSLEILKTSKAERLNLPSMPQIVFRIQDAMEKKDTSAKSLAEILTSDQGLCAKLIGLANSAYYGGSTKCHTVEEAILRVGLDETKELAVVISNRGLYAIKDPRFENDLWGLFRHSIATGIVSRLLAEHLKLDHTYLSFTYGILHDLGKLLLLRIFSEIFKNDDDIDIESLRHIAQRLHNHTGSIFVASIGFPKQITQIVLHHNEPDQIFEANEPELPLVMMANLIAQDLGYGNKLPKNANIYETPASKHLGLEPGVCSDAGNLIENYFEMLGAMA